MKLFIGLMSGTSMDGIDAALIDLYTNNFIHGITYSFDSKVREELQQALGGKPNTPGYFSQLNTLVGREFGKAALSLLEESGYKADNIIAIGSHGQTLCHDSTTTIPYTVQIGCAHTIAEMTGITVVADFRTRDLIAGGQGAPFAPVYHQELFKDQKLPLAIVNIGGIANLTYMSDNAAVSGYDLGPGNCLMDAWVYEQLNLPYDKNGRWAREGIVIESLLEILLQDSYFARPTPKSIGKEYFSLKWLTNYLPTNYAPQDVQATLLALSAQTIANGINTQEFKPEQVLICGGGAHNTALMDYLTLLLPEICVQSTQALNVNPDFIEALMFAWLAEKTISYTPLNLNKITGAKYPAILGAIYPAGIDK